jgi:hypothetical protein
MRHRFVRSFAPEQRQEQRQPLFYKSLPGEITDRLAGIALFGDRERRRERQIGILGLLGEFMMLQMIGAVAGEIGPDRHSADPLSDPLVDRLVAVQSAMRGLMHQDRQSQLTGADDHDRDQPGQRIGPQRDQCDGRNDRAPGMYHQPHPAQRTARRQAAPFFRRKNGFGIDARHDRHGKSSL